MEDDALLAIVHSDSYRSDAQELAEALLCERGLSSEAINQWRDPNAESTDPPWARDLSEGRLIKRSKIRRAALIAVLPSLIIAAAMELLSLPGGLPVLILGIVCLLKCVFWSNPLRILLLRPFGFREYAHLQPVFAKRYLSYWGHVYTLVDREIKPWQRMPPILRFVVGFFGLYLFGIPLFLLWPPRLSFNITSHEEIPWLMDFISRRVARNIVWTVSLDKLFKVTCTRDTWRRAVQYLINNCDLIVIDLSQGGEGLKWEIDELIYYGATDKVVFISHHNTASVAQSFLKSSGITFDKQIFLYNDYGWATRHDELKIALAGAAVRSLSTYKAT